MSEQIKKLAKFMGWKKSATWITTVSLEIHAGEQRVSEHKTTGWRMEWKDLNGVVHFHFNPFTDANDTLLVGARLREEGLESLYIMTLMGMLGYTFDGKHKINMVYYFARLNRATLEQRMTAALQVIQESNDEV